MTHRLALQPYHFFHDFNSKQACHCNRPNVPLESQVLDITDEPILVP